MPKSAETQVPKCRNSIVQHFMKNSIFQHLMESWLVSYIWSYIIRACPVFIFGFRVIKSNLIDRLEESRWEATQLFVYWFSHDELSKIVCFWRFLNVFLRVKTTSHDKLYLRQYDHYICNSYTLLREILLKKIPKK